MACTHRFRELGGAVGSVAIGGSVSTVASVPASESGTRSESLAESEPSSETGAPLERTAVDASDPRATGSIGRLQTRLHRLLPDRQRTVLETAYYAGFFERPRHSTGEAIADSLGITPATFHEHLRIAQHKLPQVICE